MSKVVQCQLCPRRCRLSEGMRGDCRVRVNTKGKLFTLSYGDPCAVHIDPIEKKPLFHFLPGSNAFSIATAGCNLHCKFCQNWTISQVTPEETNNKDLPPEEVVKKTIQSGCKSIAYTYSDPVIFYEYTLDTSKIARKHNIKNVLVTAAYINKEPLKELCQWVDAANIDLKGITEEYYQEISLGTLRPVLDAIKICKEEGVFVELTNLVIPTLNDSDQMIKDLCKWVYNETGPETPIHFSRFYPMYKLKNLPPTPSSTLVKARELAIAQGLKHVYIGNVPGSPGENTYCPDCNSLLIGRMGYVITKQNIKDGKCPYCNRDVYGVWN